MIYGRFHDPVELVRWATLEDVQRLEHRAPDREDRAAIANGCYLIVCDLEDRKEQLYHQAFLRADGGSAEIAAARDALPRPFTAEDFRAARAGMEVEIRPPASDKWYPATITSRTQTRLHVYVNGNADHGYSFGASDAKKYLQVPVNKRENVTCPGCLSKRPADASKEG